MERAMNNFELNLQENLQDLQGQSLQITCK